MESRLWWNGPEWLSSPPESWPNPEVSEIPYNQTLERREAKLNLNVTLDDSIFQRYSSLHKLKRFVALCKRFVHNLSKKTGEKDIIFRQIIHK